MILRGLKAALLSLLLASASAAAGGGDGSFALVGRVSVEFDQRIFAGSLRWEHGPEWDELMLMTPLGQGVAQLVRDHKGVALTTADQEVYRADDAETLTVQVLGWRLPLAGLAYWVTGRPAPGGGGAVSEEVGPVRQISQDGWLVECDRFAPFDGQLRPMWVVARREGVLLRLVIDQWGAGVGGGAP